MNSDQYENLLQMYKQVLEYYGNEHNYNQINSAEPPIMLDKGFLARNVIASVDALKTHQHLMEMEFQIPTDVEELNNPLLEQINEIARLAKEETSDESN
jgi:hypothetical protein